MKQKFSILCIVVLTVILSSCSKDDKTPNFLKVGDKSTNLTSGYISDYSSSSTYEVFKIELLSSDLDPTAYIDFRLYSPSADKIDVGTYTYTYSTYAPFKFSYLYYGSNLTYDNVGSVTGGTEFEESSSNVLDGTQIVVSKNGENYQFEITLNVKDANGNTVKVTGHFTDVLTSYKKK